MIAKIKMKLTTRLLSLLLLAAICLHVVVYGTVAFTGEQLPTAISNIWAISILAILVIMLTIVLAHGESRE